MKNLLALTCAALLPIAAAAQSCEPSTDADIATFEAAKTAFLRTDYRAFANLVDDYIPNMDAEYERLFGPLSVFEPRGFDRCRTILQRREEPSFIQEVVFYFPKGSDVPLALHLVGAEVDGQVRMLEFTYNSSISAILNELH
ncbi:hypothetical protein ACJ5NV_01705 [Loktanella agnita]|uniref:hypothetical protein n=1 Tax=Loktanella agnita TaxID=287097 RepID=UPI003985E9EE